MALGFGPLTGDGHGAGSGPPPRVGFAWAAPPAAALGPLPRFGVGEMRVEADFGTPSNPRHSSSARRWAEEHSFAGMGTQRTKFPGRLFVPRPDEGRTTPWSARRADRPSPMGGGWRTKFSAAMRVDVPRFRNGGKLGGSDLRSLPLDSRATSSALRRSVGNPPAGFGGSRAKFHCGAFGLSSNGGDREPQWVTCAFPPSSREGRLMGFDLWLVVDYPLNRVGVAVNFGRAVMIRRSESIRNCLDIPKNLGSTSTSPRMFWRSVGCWLLIFLLPLSAPRAVVSIRSDQAGMSCRMFDVCGEPRILERGALQIPVTNPRAAPGRMKQAEDRSGYVQFLTMPISLRFCRWSGK